jgi:pyridoxamine 5'-phosphate oxidase
MIKNPFTRFKVWYNLRTKTYSGDASYMILSTADSSGDVSSRVVLLKSFDEDGFVFYTNYNSKKGRHLDDNPRAALLFYWPELDKQIRIEGDVERVPEDVSNDYFTTRPRISKVGAHASRQSKVLSSRIRLIFRVARYIFKYPREVPRPLHWGGYRLKPNMFEFWDNGKYRLHDRTRYRLKVGSVGSWVIEKLYP